jgi:HSP20 family protein
MLHIRAERRADHKREDQGFVRRELRYGSLASSLVLPEGVRDSGITATYKDGILEVRIPEPKQQPATKIPITSS